MSSIRYTDVNFLIIALSLLLAPHIFNVIYYIGTTSHYFILICSTIILLNINLSAKVHYSIAIFLIFIFIYSLLVLIGLSLFSIKVNLSKFFISWICVFVMFFAALISFKRLDKYPLAIFNVSRIVVMMFAFFGVIATFGYDIYGPITERKPVFVFTESSHFVYNLAPFLLVWAKMEKSEYLFWFGFLSLAFYFFSVSSALAVVLLIFSLFFKFSYRCLYFTPLLVMFVFFVDFDRSYYVDRFFLLEVNYSNMGYLAGWDEVFYVLVNQPFGYGFQQLGINPPNSELWNLQASDSDDIYINRYDGSFFAAKIISEFGYVGLLIVIYFLRLFLISFASILKSRDDSIFTLFFHANMFGLVLYVFFRGGGYLSLQIFLLFLAILVMKNKSVLKAT